MSSVRALLLIADIGGYTEYMSTHRMSLAHAQVNTASAPRAGDRRGPRSRADRDRGRCGVPLPRRPTRRPPTLLVREVTDSPRPCTGPSTSSGSTSPATSARAPGASRRPTSRSSSWPTSARSPPRPSAQRRKLVGIDVILVHRLLKNPVPVREYVLLTEDLLRDGSSSLRDPTRAIEPDVEGFGPVRAYYVDVDVPGPGRPRRSRAPPGGDACRARRTPPGPACRTCSADDAATPWGRPNEEKAPWSRGLLSVRGGT